MKDIVNHPAKGAMIFRVALFAVSASLAVYIVYRYATSLHTINGTYAFLFPLSSILAVVGMVLAVKPTSCDCSVGIRSGIAGLSVVWMCTGLLCVPSMANLIAVSPWDGFIATSHMVLQHVFLPITLLSFALAPAWILGKLGIPWDEQTAATDKSAVSASRLAKIG